jgi:hypothetical protein
MLQHLIVIFLQLAHSVFQKLTSIRDYECQGEKKAV